MRNSAIQINESNTHFSSSDRTLCLERRGGGGWIRGEGVYSTKCLATLGRVFSICQKVRYHLGRGIKRSQICSRADTLAIIMPTVSEARRRLFMRKEGIIRTKITTWYCTPDMLPLLKSCCR